MSAPSFFENPILNSPYECPRRHWEMDADNKPTGKIDERRRKSSNRTPIATPRSKGAPGHRVVQKEFFEEIVDDTVYRANELINTIRDAVAA